MALTIFSDAIVVFCSMITFSSETMSFSLPHIVKDCIFGTTDPVILVLVTHSKPLLCDDIKLSINTKKIINSIHHMFLEKKFILPNYYKIFLNLVN
jgi:hypothetical protein